VNALLALNRAHDARLEAAKGHSPVNRRSIRKPKGNSPACLALRARAPSRPMRTPAQPLPVSSKRDCSLRPWETAVDRRSHHPRSLGKTLIFARHSGEALLQQPKWLGQAGTRLDLGPMESSSKWTPGVCRGDEILVDQGFSLGKTLKQVRELIRREQARSHKIKQWWGASFLATIR
jgi:hypothetical protein